MSKPHYTSTLGWDTVFATHIDDLNNQIAARKTSPKSFHAEDFEDAISASGQFGTWSVTTGGGGSLLYMCIPFHELIFIDEGEDKGPFSGCATVELRLQFLDKDIENDKGGSDLHLTVAPNVLNDTKSAVTVIAVEYDAVPPKRRDQSAVKLLLSIWLNSHMSEFDHVFAVVAVNASAGHDGFQWLQPTHVDYAYTDLDNGDGALAILCMTEGRSAKGLAPQLAPHAIPDNQRAAFLISAERMLEKVFLPIIPQIFRDADPNYFAIDSSRTGIKTTRNEVPFTVITKDGVKHSSIIKKFRFSIENREIEFSLTTRTNVSPGIFEGTVSENFLNLTVVSGKSGQTLSFEEVRPAIVKHWTEDDTGFTVIEIALAVISLIGLAVSAIATAGTSLAVAAFIIGLLAGVGAASMLLTTHIIDEVGMGNSPNIDKFLLNTTDTIKWTGGKLFQLETIDICGAIQMGGHLSKEAQPVRRPNI